MYEIFIMSLKDYWGDNPDLTETEVAESIEAFQEMLSEHFGKEIKWNDGQTEDEITVEVISHEDMLVLQAIAAKLELDGNLDDFDLDYDNPWDSEVLDRIQTHIEEEKEITQFQQIFTLDASLEAFVLPVDLPSPITVDLCDEDEIDEEDEEHDCDASIDVLSLEGLRKELDVVGKAIGIDVSADIESVDFETLADGDGKDAFTIAWYALSYQVDEAIKKQMPLFIQLVDEDDYDEDEGDDD